MDMKWISLAWVCGVCCGILFMLVPAVTLYVKRVLKINGVAGRPPLKTAALQPSASQVLDARRVLKERGYIIRERRSL
jgi:hypothetical protein